MNFVPSDYGPVLGPLVDVDRLRPLDQGVAASGAYGALRAATPENSFGHAKIGDMDMARCCLAGVWLLHDLLDESHSISQSVPTPSGSYWHGVMHRREGDFSNAKYWFRRVGEHEVFPQLAQCAAAVAGDGADQLVARIVSDGQWNPFAFVDACQSAVDGGADASHCRRLQRDEWELLFDFCYRSALGA